MIAVGGQMDDTIQSLQSLSCTTRSRSDGPYSMGISTEYTIGGYIAGELVQTHLRSRFSMHTYAAYPPIAEM